MCVCRCTHVWSGTNVVSLQVTRRQTRFPPVIASKARGRNTVACCSLAVCAKHTLSASCMLLDYKSMYASFTNRGCKIGWSSYEALQRRVAAGATFYLTVLGKGGDLRRGMEGVVVGKKVVRLFRLLRRPAAAASRLSNYRPIPRTLECQIARPYNGEGVTLERGCVWWPPGLCLMYSCQQPKTPASEPSHRCWVVTKDRSSSYM